MRTDTLPTCIRVHSVTPGHNLPFFRLPGIRQHESPKNRRAARRQPARHTCHYSRCAPHGSPGNSVKCETFPGAPVTSKCTNP